MNSTGISKGQEARVITSTGQGQQKGPLSESACMGSHFRENLQQTHFSVVSPVSGFISLQQSCEWCELQM